MTNPNIKNFNPGGIKDRVDSRDYQYSEIGFASSPFDWNKGYDVEVELGMTLPVKDQNGSYSCGGQAWSTYAGVLEAQATNSLEERSAKFFYAQTYQRGGGSSGRDNANVFVNQGACRESVLTSYQNGLPPDESFMTRGQDITSIDRTDALSDKSYSYAQVNFSHADSIAQAVRDNHGAIIGIDGENNGTWLSEFPAIPTQSEWQHWIYVGKVKLINGTKYFGLLNSWGLRAGDRGWQWITEAYFTSGHVWACWTHVYNPTSISTFHHNFATNIIYGQSGSEVVALQTALQVDGEFPASVPTSGLYGDITALAVLKFRQKYGMSSITDPKGHSVGPLTRNELNKIF